MSAHQNTRQSRWLALGMGLIAGLVLAELVAINMSYPTPLSDFVQALDFVFG